MKAAGLLKVDQRIGVLPAANLIHAALVSLLGKQMGVLADHGWFLAQDGISRMSKPPCAALIEDRSSASLRRPLAF
jgi:hypothetical protein